MDNLFSEQTNQILNANAPLAVKMRPKSLDEYVGQKQAVGEGTWLRQAIKADALSSLILYGPAGTGKTTLARIIAETTHAHFVEVNAIDATVKDLRQAISEAKERLLNTGVRTILFIDEIHRFSRSQQDALLHAVENRVLIMIGATTENPYFEVNSALNSRSRIIELEALSSEDISQVLDKALSHTEALQNKFVLADELKELIAQVSGGDARSALNSLELSAQIALARSSKSFDEIDEGAPLEILREDLEAANPRTGLAYDKKGDQHYDTISAFIKSMRGSDPDAAVYYLARMLDSGEDPKFIARRILILASEDIGNADPQAICVAAAAFKACEVIGMPECRINLAQAAVYMALAPKSNASYMAINKALEDVRSGKKRDIPNYLRDRHRPGSEEYGSYLYPHSYEGGYVEQQYLPGGLSRGDFYRPTERGWEGYQIDSRQRDLYESDFQSPTHASEDE